MDTNRIIKLLIVFVAPLGLLLFNPPAGLSKDAWILFALYISTILGLILRPVSEPAVLLTVMGIAGAGFNKITPILSGYAASTAWLVFAAYLVSRAFIDTGLGRRVALHLIAYFGKTSLGLGYVAAITDLLVSPATPSNTARTGGIIYPIFRSLASTLGSEPGESSRKLGAYLTILLYHVSLSTGMLFLTAMAPNLLVADFAKKIMNVDVTWMVWAKAAMIPCMLTLLLVPYVLYKLYPPELKHISNYKELSAEGLREMGPVKTSEKILAVLFILAVLAWSSNSIIKIDATGVAVAFIAGCILTGVVSWESILKEKGAWSTLIWFGGIIGLAGALAKAGFFGWMAQSMQKYVSFDGMNPYVVLTCLLLLSLVVRYLFASMAAYVGSFIPVIFTIGLAAKVPLMPLALLCGFSAGYGCMLTHYGGALGPVLFGTGYVDQRTWWLLGLVTVGMNIIVQLAIGLPYWRMIGLW